MKSILVLVTSLALVGSASAADDVTSKVDGTLTVHFAPPKSEPSPSRPEQCSEAWNTKLSEARSKAIGEGKEAPKVGRMEYRNCMYRCLEAKADPAAQAIRGVSSDGGRWPCHAD